MRPLFLLIHLVSCLIAGTNVAAHAQEAGKKAPKDRNYYPLDVGNEWQYKVTNGANTSALLFAIAEIDTINGVPLARLEASVNDRVVATEHLTQTADGVFRYRNNGQKIEPPICLLKYPVKSGDKWDGPIGVGKDKGKYTAEAKEESVEVPAGKFKATRVTIHIDAKGKTTVTYWFVANLGFVKQTVQSGTNSPIVLELEKSMVKGKKS